MRDPRHGRWTLVALAIGVVLVAATPAGAVTRGTYRGRTSQDRAIRFVVQANEIRDVRFSVFHDPCNLTVNASSGAAGFEIAEDDSFVMRFVANDKGARIVVRGEFTSTSRARGRLRSVQDDRDCRDVVRATWRVHRVERS